MIDERRVQHVEALARMTRPPVYDSIMIWYLYISLLYFRVSHEREIQRCYLDMSRVVMYLIKINAVSFTLLGVS